MTKDEEKSAAFPAFAVHLLLLVTYELGCRRLTREEAKEDRPLKTLFLAFVMGPSNVVVFFTFFAPGVRSFVRPIVRSCRYSLRRGRCQPFVRIVGTACAIRVVSISQPLLHLIGPSGLRGRMRDECVWGSRHLPHVLSPSHPERAVRRGRLRCHSVRSVPGNCYSSRRWP